MTLPQRWTPILLLLLAAPNARAQPHVSPTRPAQTDNPLTTRIDSAVNRAALTVMRDSNVTGLCIGVITHAGVSMYAYGETANGNRRLPTPTTLYPIASITKTVTGTLLAQAVVEGRLRLDDDVRRYLPGDYPNLAFDGHPIRLAHLIMHRSGLPYEIPDSSRAHAEYTRKDFYSDLHAVVLDTIPGYRFKYSGAAAQLLGYILEDVYHMTFEQLVATKIAAPAHLTDTHITLTPVEARRVASGYDSVGPIDVSRYDALQAAGGLKSTLADLTHYVSWQIDETDPAVRLSHAPRLTYGNYQVGLNWQMMNAGGLRTIWQDGGLPGYTSLAVAAPELHIGVAVLSSGSGHTPGTYQLANEILTAMDAHAVHLP
jgi:D-alanyl-D-alanine-carboxypeptidase/D-alanyl-D-alanine-endopeptidase